jgi:adenine-specific DNA-methyltransferase
MASLFHRFGEIIRVLDAGAGMGTLLAALTAEACQRSQPPRVIQARAFELDALLAAHLRKTARECQDACRSARVRFGAQLVEADFIAWAVEQLDRGESAVSFTHAILNPPYKKLSSDSTSRLALRRAGIETSNLYTAFLALAILLLEPGGELVAITPRSFCNGPYFRPFRELLLREMSLRRIHVFDSRTAAFADDEVLQENVIIHAVKGKSSKKVIVSSSRDPEEEPRSVRHVPVRDVVRPEDPELFFHVVPNEAGRAVAEVLARLPSRLGDLGLAVSTGKVVDFRARDFLRPQPVAGAGPLIYPAHFCAGVIRWPKLGKKPNALVHAPRTAQLWMPSGTYVLVKRFSSKEERRRVVAAIFDPALVPGERVGFENHLNVFHQEGRGLRPVLARGLAAFLNSTLVDVYFRQFNGHTQVNATDLRSLRYPSLETLERLGRRVRDPGLAQGELDRIVEDAIGHPALR